MRRLKVSIADRCRVLVLFSSLLIGAGMVFGASAAPVAASVHSVAIPSATTLTYTGGQQNYIVPGGVDLLGVEASGAYGGGGNPGMPLGGYLKVHGGETLYAEVGQNGSYGGRPTFGGGGAAGAYPGPGSNNTFAGSGGGASDVRSCSDLAATCPGGVTSIASRLLVGGGGGGTGGEGAGPGFYCTQLPQRGRGYNQQRPLPGGNASQGPVPVRTTTGLVIPGENADYNYGAIADVTAARGGSTTAGAGGSLSSCNVYSDNKLKATFSPTVSGPAASGPSGAVGGSITGTSFATPEGPSHYLPGAGGGGGGGYAGGGGGSAGYVCTYPSACYNPSLGMGGGGGSSFASHAIRAPFIDYPNGSGSVTLAPILEIDSPINGARYSPGQVVRARWSCGGGGTLFQGTSCSPATDASGSPIDTKPGSHTFSVAVNPVQNGPRIMVSVRYTVKSPSKSVYGAAAGFRFTLTGPGDAITPRGKLTVTLTRAGSSHNYKVESYSYFIDHGVKHGTVFSPNLVTSMAGTHSLLLSGLSAGAHKLKLVILLQARRHGHKPTTKKLTLTLPFTLA